MAREYLIINHGGGAFLRIREEGKPNEHVNLQAASDPGRIREGERVINERFYGVEPFPGFDWVMRNHGAFTTDHDYRGA